MPRWRIPPVLFHPQSGHAGSNFLRWAPGYRATGLRPIRRPVITAYGQVLSQIPLTGGQATVTVQPDGTAQAAVGPQALGTIWYPAQATLNTTTGAADLSTAQVFLGSTGVPNNMVGQSYAAGQDTIGLAVPALAPGQLLICQWSGATPGAQATINIIGTMDVLTTA